MIEYDNMIEIDEDELEALRKDKDRLNFLQRQGGGRKWISRPSSTGRGYRLYTETTRQAHNSVREAIDTDMKDEKDNVPIWERQRIPIHLGD
jgi:hypothetical protein